MVIKNKRIIFNSVSISMIVISLVLLGIGLFSGVFPYTVKRLVQYHDADIYCTNMHVVNRGTVSKNIKYCRVCGAEAGFIKQLSCTNCGKYLGHKEAQYCSYCGKEYPRNEQLIKPPVSDDGLMLYWCLFIPAVLCMCCQLLDRPVVMTTRNRVEGIAIHSSGDEQT